MSNLKPPPIYKFVLSQFAAAFSLALIALVALDVVMAYSVLIGGCICAIANAYFAKKTFTYSGARSTTMMIKAIYMGEFVKLLLITAGLGVAFVFVNPLNIVFLFSGFIIVHIVGIFAVLSMQSAQRSQLQRLVRDS
jgi:ATP synthase protein I